MRYNQPFDKPSDPTAPYVNGVPAAGIQGSIPPAAALEHPQREIVHVIEFSGQTPDGADLQQLRKAIQWFIGGLNPPSDPSSFSSGYQNLPIWPEVNTALYGLGCTTSTGSIVVNDNQTFSHRGWRIVSTSFFTLANRSFATVANKTYHLVWYAPGVTTEAPALTYPNGRFMLRDVTDLAYNPTGVPGFDKLLDTTFDRINFGTVTTDAANAVTYWPCRHKSDRRFVTEVAQGSPSVLLPWDHRWRVVEIIVSSLENAPVAGTNYFYLAATRGYRYGYFYPGVAGMGTTGSSFSGLTVSTGATANHMLLSSNITAVQGRGVCRTTLAHSPHDKKAFSMMISADGFFRSANEDFDIITNEKVFTAADYTNGISLNTQGTMPRSLVVMEPKF